MLLFANILHFLHVRCYEIFCYFRFSVIFCVVVLINTFAVPEVICRTM